jgi:hypothetical protein
MERLDEKCPRGTSKQPDCGCSKKSTANEIFLSGHSACRIVTCLPHSPWTGKTHCDCFNVNFAVPRARENHDGEAVASYSGPGTTCKKTAGREKDCRKVRPERYAVMLDPPGVGRCRACPILVYPPRLTDTAWKLRSDS